MFQFWFKKCWFSYCIAHAFIANVFLFLMFLKKYIYIYKKKHATGFLAKIVFGFLFLVDLVLKNQKVSNCCMFYHTFFLFPHFFEIWAFFVYGDFCASLFANVGFHIFCMFMCFCVLF